MPVQTKVKAGSRSNPDEHLQPVLRLMRAENWFIGIGVAAILVAGTAAPVLNGGDPARTVAEVVIALAVCALVVAVVGFIVTNVREERAFDRALPFGDVSALMDKHKWTEAIGKLEVAQASADPSSSVQAWNMLGQCYAATGRNAESEAMIRRSIDVAGDSNETLGEQLACLGVVVRRQGRIEEAEELMARALDIFRNRDPEGTVFVLRNMAYLHWVKGEHDQAREIYDNLPMHDPDQLTFLTQVLEPFVEPGLPKTES
jgi:tetratricopeptide (TPR) repeat protein